MLGYIVGEGKIRPDPEHLQPLLQLLATNDMMSLRRVLGCFCTTAHGSGTILRSYYRLPQCPPSRYPENPSCV